MNHRTPDSEQNTHTQTSKAIVYAVDDVHIVVVPRRIALVSEGELGR